MNRNNVGFPRDPDDAILTTGAAATLLGVSVSTMQLWISSGAIASWKTPGGHRRVLRSAVLAMGAKSGRVCDSASNVGKEADEFCLADYEGRPLKSTENDRLKALAATGLVDTAPERVFDRLTWLATKIADTPMALISLLTSRRQWFKSKVGVELSETAREWAFCHHAIQSNMPFVVHDAVLDERFAQNPLVTGSPYIRFYAGVPLVDRHGYRLGTLCVLDSRPRVLQFEAIRALEELAAIGSEEIARRH